MPRKVSKSRELIASRFRILRIAAGLRPVDVYQALELPKSTFNSIESGQHLPNVIICGILCAFYDAPVDFILTGTGLNRELRLPRNAEIMLKQIMTPMDLQEQNTSRGKSGFLTLRVASLPPAKFDLSRMILRSPAADVKKAVSDIRKAAPEPMMQREIKGAGFLTLKPTPKPKSRAKAKKAKFALGDDFKNI